MRVLAGVPLDSMQKKCRATFEGAKKKGPCVSVSGTACKWNAEVCPVGGVLYWLLANCGPFCVRHCSSSYTLGKGTHGEEEFR